VGRAEQLKMDASHSISNVRKALARIPASAWPALLVIACLAPFCRHAFTIDDPLYIRAAEQIRRHPIDFYGFTINWFGVPTPMPASFENPPLTCYFIAFVSLLVGWSEAALHLAFLLPAIAAAVGIHALAKYHCQRPLLATVVSVLTPAFLVSAATVMCDVMMLAFWVWSLVFFERGLDRKKLSEFLASGVLMGLAVLTKFPGLALVPLLAVYGFSRARRVGPWAPGLLIPLLFLAGYELLTRHLYGHGLFFASAAYTAGVRADVHQAGLENLIVGLAFTGGCFLPVLFLSPGLWSGRIVGTAALCAVPAVICPALLPR